MAFDRSRPPVAANTVLLVLFVGGVVFQLFLLPLFFLERNPLWAWGLVPVVLATPIFWALAHEAMHGVFHPDRRTNEGVGRLMGVLLGASFRTLRFGHLMHHRFSRTSFDASEAYDPTRRRWICAAIAYYPRILFGLYGVEILGNLLAFLPRPLLRKVVRGLFRSGDDIRDVGDLAVHELTEGMRLAEIRLDSLLALSLLIGGAWAYGEQWPLFLVSLLGRGLLISFLDNAPHYGSPMGDRFYAYNLGLPLWASRLLLHFNLHRVHHRHPTLPWNALPSEFSRSDRGYDGPWATIVLRQLRGPIPLDRLPRAKG